ncbi:S8 family serine peptidase [Algoriphagus sp. CAU 1675]|uniref:S8 family serine peptidase n=1 Tax=Algoriphagus sp. CAU 1675 TaxID=3032597 RepID=UPI0023DA7E1D|nr:S8 family serine peptidase [Algoriphagus sp. CAU 1675]MDF2157688.1 S8 family serine peptidase [Algoriphagus sp. CAU 1675]
MAVNKLFSLFLGFFLLNLFQGFAQDRYAVYYKFKPQSVFSLDQPQEFLTQKALDRRQREGVNIDSLDLPVSQIYIDQVSAKSEYLLYHSKWMNASVLVASEVAVQEIALFPFVEKVELVAPGFFPIPDARVEKELPSKFRPIEDSESRLLSSQENAYDFQNALLGIPDMQEAGFLGAGITIAVFDSGFPGVNTASSLKHLFDNNQIIATRDFVRPWNTNVYQDYEHGTNVLSLIAANEPGVLVSGAPEANYFLAMTEYVYTEYKIEEFNWTRAAEFADSLGVDIINSSLGYYDFDDVSMNYGFEDLDGASTVITQAANIASQRGILVVNSVGNYGPNESTLIAPADSPNVLAIGSVKQDQSVSTFSSRGPTADGRIKPDLDALGSGVVMLRPSGNTGLGSGTSYSAPQITALAAGVWQARPEWTRAKLIQNLLRSASQYENPDNILGYGIPGFLNAYFGEILSVEENPEHLEWKVYPNPVTGGEIEILFGRELEAELVLFDLSGREVHNSSLIRNSIKEPYYLNLKNLKPGMYLVTVQDRNTVKRNKLLIR